jgi:hypothetical protein
MVIHSQPLKPGMTPAERLAHCRMSYVPFLSQQALGEAVKVKGYYIGYCERGEKPIDEALGVRLARFFGVDSDFFVSDLTTDPHGQCVSNTRSAFTRVMSKTTPPVLKDTSPLPKEDSLSQSEIGRGIKRGREGELLSLSAGTVAVNAILLSDAETEIY